MAAKVATRSKNTTAEYRERFVVVNTNTMRRVYLGPGVDEKTATALAETLMVPAVAVPAGQVVEGVYMPPESSEATAETEEPVAA